MQPGLDAMAQSPRFTLFSVRPEHRPMWAIVSLLLIILATQPMLNHRSAHASANSVAMLSSSGLRHGLPAVDVERIPVGGNVADTRWVIGSNEALSLIDQGATLVDARSVGAQRSVPGTLPAISLQWQDLSHKAFQDRGVPVPALQGVQFLADKGITNQRPVIVLGDWRNGWGEDGRVVWTLRKWGYQQVYMVDGGHLALETAQASWTKGSPDGLVKHTSHDYSCHSGSPVTRTHRAYDALEVSTSELQSLLGHQGVVFLDAREPREYAGETPYGEARGGHLPGAVNVWFKLFMSEQGTLRSADEVRELLVLSGVLDPASIHGLRTIVVYGSGGFRSAWVASVLSHYGYDVRHYAGSMWQWSYKPWFSYPLVTASR